MTLGALFEFCYILMRCYYEKCRIRRILTLFILTRGDNACYTGFTNQYTGMRVNEKIVNFCDSDDDERR